VVLGYSDAASNQAANATAMQNGKTYKITGTAAGVDVANSQQAVTKSFEMDMTCP
jgi:ipoprotein LpqH